MSMNLVTRCITHSHVYISLCFFSHYKGFVARKNVFLGVLYWVLSTFWPLLRKIRIDTGSCLVWIKLTCKFAVAEKEERNYSTIAGYCLGAETYCHKCICFLLTDFKAKMVSCVFIWISIWKYLTSH